MMHHFPHWHGYVPNLDAPRTFSEKVAYRFCKERDDIFWALSNKLDVRTFVKERLGTDLAVPLLAVYTWPSAEELARLPRQFVLKTSHGSGRIRIVLDRDGTDLRALARRFRYLLSTPSWGSWRYNWFPRRRFVLAEEALVGQNGGMPRDYKFHCFHSRSGFDWVLQIDHDRFSEYRQDIYDRNLQPMPFAWNNLGKMLTDFYAPENFEFMIDVARELS